MRQVVALDSAQQSEILLSNVPCRQHLLRGTTVDRHRQGGGECIFAARTKSRDAVQARREGVRIIANCGGDKIVGRVLGQRARDL